MAFCICWRGLRVAVALLTITILTGCAGLSQPPYPPYQGPYFEHLKTFYAKDDAIPQDENVKSSGERDRILREIMYLVDVNFESFANGLRDRKAFFDTVTDLTLLGLGSAGALSPSAATKSILAAISAGVAGGRVSINKNFFHDQAIEALTAKMRAERAKREEIIIKGIQLTLLQYPLSQGIRDTVKYYNAGTLLGAIEAITATAGEEFKNASNEIDRTVVLRKYNADTKVLQDRLNVWLRDGNERNPLNTQRVTDIENWIRQAFNKTDLAGIWLRSAPETEVRATILHFNVP